MAFLRRQKRLKLSAITDQNWHDSYIDVRPFTVREVQEYADKINSITKKKNSDKEVLSYLIEVIKDRFVEAKLYDVDEKSLKEASFEDIEQNVLSIDVAKIVIGAIGGGEEKKD